MPNPNSPEADSPRVDPHAPPGAGLDFSKAQVIVDLFNHGATANLQSKLRKGSAAVLPDRGRVIVSGDLHDHGLNFMRLLRLAALHESPQRHLILHEIIHGPARVNGRDMSVRSLARVAALKAMYPDQVHVMLANHELAQLNNENILKDGLAVVGAFDDGIDFIYGDWADDVRHAMFGFIRSMLLGVRCPGGVFISHSLPAPRQLDRFDLRVIDREPTDEDLRSGGSAYLMVWGRKHNRAVAEVLGQAWGASLFVMGHEPAEMGYEVIADQFLILNSDHDHGVALNLDLSRPPTDMDDLVGQMIPLASVVL